MGSFMDRGNQYIQWVKVLYCKLPSNGKQLPAFLYLRSGQDLNSNLRGGRRECYHSATVAPCVDEEGNGFDPTVKRVSNHGNPDDYSSLRSEISYSNEDSPTKILLGEMTDNATDWLRSTKATIVTWEGSTKVFKLDF